MQESGYEAPRSIEDTIALLQGANGNARILAGGSYWTLPVQTDAREVRLPLQPLWLGFASNTVFFTAITFLITIVPKIVGRHVRFKRKCCLVCGYDLRGDFSAGCPECGWQRKVEA